MDMELGQPAFLGDLKERRRFRGAGVIDQYVDLAEFPDHARDEPLGLIIVTNIGGRRPGFSAERPDLGSGSRGPFRIDIGDRHVGPAPGQPQSDFLANSPTRTSYQRRLPIEFRHLSSPKFLVLSKTH